MRKGITPEMLANNSVYQNRLKQLKLFQEGKRECCTCKEIKSLNDFNNDNSVAIIKKEYSCKKCAKIKDRKEKIRKAKKKAEEARSYVEKARSSEWYQNYLKEKMKRPRNKQGNVTGAASNDKIFKDIRRKTYLQWQKES